MEIWFTSDTHFHHKNVIAYCNRPFVSIEHMNEALITNWNAYVKPDDLIYILGDFCFGGVSKIKAINERLNGKKWLIRGNHDDERVLKRGGELGFFCVTDSCREGFRWATNGIDLTMSHYPYEGDSSEIDRYVERRPIDYGRWLLHGHVHNTWKIKDRMINVGCDVWDYKPIHLDQVLIKIQENSK